ncbi:MAG: enoyl-CoA hydratase/isomerase family protein [Bacteroidales bacterium]
MDYQFLNLEIQDSIAILRINRPEALNALNNQVLENLNKLLRDLSRNKSLRAMVLTGEGKAFIAGADIKELAAMSPSQAYSFSRLGQQAFLRLEQLDFPVIAAVNGFALGGGCELALACDMRLASSNARFGLPEVSLGLIPGFAGTQRICSRVGYSNGMYLMSTAEIIDAQEAYRMGLVQRICEPSQLLDQAIEIGKKMAANGRYAIRAVKELALKSFEADFFNAAELESESFAGLFGKPEATEGMNAFIEKRKPKWQ